MTLSPSQATKLRELVKALEGAANYLARCDYEYWKVAEEEYLVAESQLDAYITSLTGETK